MAKVSLRLYDREIEKLIDGSHIEEAIAHCKHILQTYPKHIDTYRLLGKAYLENQRYGESTDIFQRVLASAPDDFVAHIGLSIIREDEANLDTALWHMERAFEVQPSNSAIQDELRRLYGRRDGLEPPRIRLTRGALVRMYARGDLYLQAIAEIRALLAKEPQRPDIQVLLARMCFLSGKKVEAIEVCGELLNKYPYCYEANRILAEILPGTSRSEDAKIYRQRVISLDPYMAFTSIERPTPLDIPDNAVILERLDWQQYEENGYAQPNWAESLGINLDESGVQALPALEWLDASNPALQAPTAQAAESPAASLEQKSPSEPAATVQPPASGTGDIDHMIPEWMRDSGWTKAEGQGTGEPIEQVSAFSSLSLDNSSLAKEETDTGEIKPGAIPDWLQALAPDVPVDDQTTAIDKNFEQLFASTPVTAAEPELTVEVHPASEEPAPSGQVEEAPVLETDLHPNAVAAAENAEMPDWLKGFKPEEKVESEEELPAWFNEDQGDVIHIAEPAVADGIPGWLSEINQAPAVQESTPQPVVENEPVTTPGAVAQDANELPGWLSDLVTPKEGEEGAVAVLPGERRSSVSAWIQEAQAESPLPKPGEAPTVGDENLEPGELPNWMKSLEPVETKESPAPIDAIETPIHANRPEALPTETAPVAPLGSGLKTFPDWLQFLETSAVEENQASPELTTRTSPDQPTPDAQPTVAVSWPKAALPDASVPDTGVPDWLTEEEKPSPTPQAEITTLADSTLVQKPIGSLDNWLHKVENEASSTAPTQPVKVKPSSTGETPQDQAPVAPLKEHELTPEPQEDVLPEWLKGLGTDQTETDAISEKTLGPLPDWLAELETGSTLEAYPGEPLTPAEPAAHFPDWLSEFTEAPVEEASAPIGTQTTINEVVPSGTTPTTPVDNIPSLEDQDAALAWLEGLAAKHGADGETLFVKPEDRLEAPPAWVQESAAEVTIPEPAIETPQVETTAASFEPTEPEPYSLEEPLSQTEALPDWLQELKGSPKAETPVGPTHALAAMDQDAALAWLEGLAAKHGADEETLFVKPEERQETPPTWVQTAAAEAAEAAQSTSETSALDVVPAVEKIIPATAETPPQTTEMPVSTAVSAAPTNEDAALAWLENLADKHGAVEETLFVKPEDRLETPPIWVQAATAEAVAAAEAAATAGVAPPQPGIETEPVAETTPPQATPIASPTSEEDAGLAWLESLAAKHGADEETLFVKPEERQETAPAWVQEVAAQAAAAQVAQILPVKAEESPAVQSTTLEEPETPTAEITYSPTVETGTSPKLHFAPEVEAVIPPEAAASNEQPAQTTPVTGVEPARTANDTSLPEWLRGFETEEIDTPTQPNQMTPVVTPQKKVGAAPQPVEETTTWLASFAKSEAKNAGGVAPENEVEKKAPTAYPSDETLVMKRPEVVPPRPAAKMAETTAAVEKQTDGGDDWQAALSQAQTALYEGQIDVALEGYGHLINSGQLIDEAIHDLRDALYHYPVEVTIWQTLGDAYVRTNHLQDALDAYTKAEELIR